MWGRAFAFSLPVETFQVVNTDQRSGSNLDSRKEDLARMSEGARQSALGDFLHVEHPIFAVQTDDLKRFHWKLPQVQKGPEDLLRTTELLFVFERHFAFFVTYADLTNLHLFPLSEVLGE